MWRHLVLLLLLTTAGWTNEFCPGPAGRCVCKNATFMTCDDIKATNFTFLAGADNTTKWTNLRVTHNNLSTVPDNVFKTYGIIALTELILNDNEIVTINTGSFNGLHKLKVLNLSGNKIEFIEKSVFLPVNSTLETLDLTRNFLTKLDFVKAIKAIKNLSLHTNRISVISKDHFLRNSNLEILNLRNNSLISIENGAFRANRQLYKIILSENLFSSFNFLQEMAYVQQLFLQSNNISAINEHTFENNPELRDLRLEYNKITQINFTFNNVELLEIYLTRNLISYIHPDAFTLCTKLFGLQLEENKLTNIDFVQGIPKLRMLYLNKNDIHSISSDAFKMNGELTRLEMNENKLINIHFLANIPKLSTACLNNNQISVINTPVLYMSHLKYLDLSYNTINHIEFNTFQNLNEIKTLVLSNNNLTEVVFLSDFSNLKKLYLNNNTITKIPSFILSKFSKLSILELDNTNISNLNFICDIPSLKELYIYSCSISPCNSRYILGNATKICIVNDNTHEMAEIDSLPNVEYFIDNKSLVNSFQCNSGMTLDVITVMLILIFPLVFT